MMTKEDIVEFEPHGGMEMGKTRPAIVLSSDVLRHLDLRLLVPITDWNPKRSGKFWHVRISPASDNGLFKESSADCFQIHSFDLSRFVRKLGQADERIIQRIQAAIAAIIDIDL
jgi:mRNA interferase MazF